MQQLNLLPNKLHNKQDKSYYAEDYILSTSNVEVYQKLLAEQWGNHCMILYGQDKTGKTHLSHVWQKNNNAIFLKSPYTLQKIEQRSSYIIEDINLITNEAELLHCYNLTKEYNCKLLLTTKISPKLLPYKLLDLRSRLLSVPLLKLHTHDEFLLRVILLKEFSVRQIKISQEVIEYIISHVERSIPQLMKIVNTIDVSSMQSRRNITIPFIREILQ